MLVGCSPAYKWLALRQLCASFLAFHPGLHCSPLLHRVFRCRIVKSVVANQDAYLMDELLTLHVAFYDRLASQYSYLWAEQLWYSSFGYLYSASPDYKVDVCPHRSIANCDTDEVKIFQFLVQSNVLRSCMICIAMPRILKAGYIDIGKACGRTAYVTGLLFEPKYQFSCTICVQRNTVSISYCPFVKRCCL